MEHIPGVVVLLEGSEQCGKTTLADKLRAEFKADYLHGDRPDASLEDFHRDMCDCARNMASYGHIVVLDRCFVSHEVYGQLFDGGPEYSTDDLREDLASSLDLFGNILLIVYCRPEREFDPEMREEMYDDSDGAIQRKFDEIMEPIFKEMPNNCVLYDWKSDPDATTIINLIKELRSNDA